MFCYYLFNSMMWQAVMTVFLICIFLTKWSNVAVKYFFSHRGTTTWDFRLLCWFFIPIFYWIFLVVISFFLLWHHITLLDFPAESVHMVIHRGDAIYITRDYIVRQTKKLSFYLKSCLGITIFTFLGVNPTSYPEFYQSVGLPLT